MEKKFTQHYNPLYFLSALGNGGLAVSFYIYLMFMIKHLDSPLATFDHIYRVLLSGNGIAVSLTAIALIGIIFFSVKHFALLIWNIKEYSEYKRSNDFIKLKNSNAEINLMALPLTYAMSINVVFILGAVFVPNLWRYVEYLFPFALAAYLIIGLYSLKIFSEYFSRIVIKGDFDFINNNSLSQLLSSFAFSMVGVGFASPGAMSHNKIVYVVGILGAIFFSTISVLLLTIKIVLGFKSIFKHGLSNENSPSLWIAIPIMTLLGITFVRVASGIFHNMLHLDPPPVLMFFVLAIFISIQIIFGLIGYSVLSESGYFKDYVYGKKTSVGSYSLICPGVASFVLGMFFIHWGLVKTNILSMYSLEYYAIISILTAIQIITIVTLNKIDSKHMYRMRWKKSPVQQAEKVIL